MQSLFWMIVSNTAVACVIALAAWAAFRFRRPALAHGLWLLVIVKLITPPLWHVPVEISGPLAPAAPGATALAASADAAHASPWRVERPAVVAADAQFMAPAAGSGTGSSAGISAGSGARIGAGSGAAAAAPGPTAAATAIGPSKPIPWAALLVAGWMVGSIAWAAVAALRIRRLHCVLRSSPAPEEPLRREIDRLARQVGLGRAPDVRIVDVRLPPLVFFLGVRRPMMILPRELVATIDAEQRTAILTHELVHLYRGDHWVRLLEAAATLLLWWHPLLWLARRELGEAEEQCCDAWVVALLPQARRRYADVLVDALEHVCLAPLPLPSTGLGRLSTLQRRITMILHHSPQKSLSWVARAAMAGALLLLPVSPLPGVENQAAAPLAGGQKKPAPAATAPMDDGTRTAVVALFTAAQDQNPLVNEAARHAILRFGPKAAPVLIDALAAEATTPIAVQLLSQMGEPGLAPLAGALRAEPAAVRRGALQAIEMMMSPFGKAPGDEAMGGFVGGPDGVPGAMGADMMGYGAAGPAWNSAPEIVDAAKRCMDAVAELVSDPDATVREAAARVLGQTGRIHEPERAAKMLMGALKDSDVKVRTAAANALLYLAPAKPETAEALAATLSDEDPGVRLAVLQVLWRMGPAATPAMATVTATLRDETPAIRAMAAQALGAMQARPQTPGSALPGGGPGGFAPGGGGIVPGAAAPNSFGGPLPQ